MRARLLVAAIGALALGGAALWVLRADERTAPEPIAPATPQADAPPRPLTPTEASSPGEARLLAELEEERGTYQSMRASFRSGGRRSPPAEARAIEALRKIPGARSWRVTCRGELCEFGADGPEGEWQRAAQDAPSLRAIAQRLALDPDGAGAAYLVLAPAGSVRGHDVLGEVETEFTRSSDARYCLSGAGATGSVEYELSVDASGYSYRTTTDLPREVVECVNGVLGDILRLAPVPPQGATLATRTFGLRR